MTEPQQPPVAQAGPQPVAPATEDTAARGHGFFMLLSDVLFHPVATFRLLASRPEPDPYTGGKHPLPIWTMAAILLALVALTLVFVQASGPVQPAGFIAGAPFLAAIHIVLWALSTVMVIGLMWLTRGDGRAPTFLLLSALSTLPWLLLGPIDLLFAGGEWAGSLAVLFGLVIWGWSTWLFALALQVTYQLRLIQVIGLLVLPIFLGWAAMFYMGTAIWTFVHLMG